jgi:nitrogen fixation NifU-like protein
MVKDIQKKIDHKEEETYSKKVIREYRKPNNFGFIKNPDATGQIKGPCNDTMRIDLKVRNNVIQGARFWTDGCGATIASGNMLIKMVKGKALKEARFISKKNLLNALDGLPKEHLHCAELAIDTFRSVLDQLEKTVK